MVESELISSLIERRDLNRINEFVKNGGNINVILKNKLTPLLHAIELVDRYDSNITDNFDALDSDESFSEEDLVTLSGCKEKVVMNVDESCRRTNDIILCIINAGADVHCRHPCGMTPLMLALFKRRTYDVVYRLIHAGSDINARCGFHSTPLIYAVKNNYSIVLIKYFIREGVNINHRDNSGRTALFYAVIHCSFEIVSLLIDSGAEVNVRDNYGMTALANKVDCKGCKEGKCMNKKTIDLLLNNGLVLNRHDYVLILFRVNCVYLINLCIKHGVPVDTHDNYGMTPLMRAVSYEDIDKVYRLLFLFGADPKCTDSELNTPLHYANLYNSYKIIDMLLYHGSDLFMESLHNETLLKKILGIDFFRGWNSAVGMQTFIKHYLLYSSENGFNINSKYPVFAGRSFYTVIHGRMYSAFIDYCEKELAEMKSKFIKENMTFYEFCMLKKTYYSKVIDIYVDQYNYSYQQIKEFFPLYFDIIFMRIKDNEKKLFKKFLTDSLENIIIRPLPVCDDSQLHLKYYCMRHIACYLDCEQLYNLFCASL